LYLYPSFIEIMAHSVFLGIVGPWQIVLIVAIVLLLFGGRKIPELMRGLGGGVKEFKKAMREEDDETPKDDSKKLS
jgi:sec-independent protein translocase protein TatA